jgi:hypothetical protein
MRTRAQLIAVVALVTLSVASAAAIGSGQVASSTTATAVAELQLTPTVAGGPRGVGLFRQTGATLRGWVVIWGLQPRSKHAVHFHGPRSACGRKADPVAAHADLRADARGVAYAKVGARSPVQVLRKGFYYNVHQKPSIADENPEIVCANVVPIP